MVRGSELFWMDKRGVCWLYHFNNHSFIFITSIFSFNHKVSIYCGANKETDNFKQRWIYNYHAWKPSSLSSGQFIYETVKVQIGSKLVFIGAFKTDFLDFWNPNKYKNGFSGIVYKPSFRSCIKILFQETEGK